MVTLDGLSAMLWLKRRHLRAGLNFWLWAAGTDLDEARDLSERIYLLYLVVIVGGCVAACWTWVLHLVTGAARASTPEMASVTADAALAMAGAALVFPACAAALWSVRAGWRAPWVASAPDAAWLAQTPVALACWSACELVPRMVVRACAGGAAGYLVAAFTASAHGADAGLSACLPYAVCMGLAMGAAYALAWLVGEVRLRLGADRRIPLVCGAVAAGLVLVIAGGARVPQLTDLSRALIMGGGGAFAPVVCGVTALLLAVAAVLFAVTVPVAALTCEATDVSTYAVRYMAIYDPKMHRALIRDRNAARHKVLGRMPRAHGAAAVLARSAISLVRRYDMLPQLLAAGAILAPSGAVLLAGSLSGMSARLGLLGGEAGGRVLGAACWLLFALAGAELPRTLAHTFTADRGNRFMRDHLPVRTPVLFALDVLPHLAVAGLGSVLVCALAAVMGAETLHVLELLLLSIALDITLACCGAFDATARAFGKRGLSCESALGIAAAADAFAAALLPVALVPAAFLLVAGALAAVALR